MRKAISWALKNNAPTSVALCLAVMLTLGSGAALAQNNTGYPSGTKCQDLQEPRRSACTDAFDPRPNPQEILNMPAVKPILPKAPRALNQPVPQFAPKNQQESVPPPLPRIPSPIPSP